MNELDRDGLQDMDYDVMKRVIQCEGKREVWTIVNAYKDPVFQARIEAYEVLAQPLGAVCQAVRFTAETSFIVLHRRRDPDYIL